MNYTTILKKISKGFTLLETLASISVLSLVIIGPLSVTISSSGYARLTKDTIVATYLAEEAIELLQNQYDSIYIYCKKNVTAIDPGELCEVQGDELTTGQTAWRLYKDRLSGVDGQPTCFLPKGSSGSYPGDALGNPDGCAFDYDHLQASSTEILTRIDASSEDCEYLVPVATSTTYMVASTTGGGVYKDRRPSPLAGEQGDGDNNYQTYYISKQVTATSTRYLCKSTALEVIPGGKVQAKQFKRSITVDQIPTFETGNQDEQYNDDLRITSSVQFKALNGVSHTIKVTRFMHARP